MRTDSTIKDKISEINAANEKRKRFGKKPNLERIDIVNGLETVLSKGKYGTLHDWEERKRELKDLENKYEFGLPKNWRRGMYGEMIPGDKLDSLAWKMGAYRWALQIGDPTELMISQQLTNSPAKKKAKKKTD